MSAETITRPNGKPYRRRSPLRVEMFDTYDEDTGVVVLGTHDVATATALAADVLAEYDLADLTPTEVWWRLVPWDTTGWHDRTWIVDTVRGTPALVWKP